MPDLNEVAALQCGAYAAATCSDTTTWFTVSWNDAGYTTSAVSGSTSSNLPVNGGWATATTASYHVPATWTFCEPVELRPDQLAPLRAEPEDERRRREELRAERRARWEAAEGRARETLVSLLSPGQRAELDRYAAVTVLGSEGHWFRLDVEYCDGNVSWIDPGGGDVLGRMCAHPYRYADDDEALPMSDVIIGQLLAITADERDFVRRANQNSGVRPTYPDVTAGQ